MDFPIHHKFLRLLNEPHTFADIHGGRGGMKSEQTHKVALLDAIRRPLRTVCARETMSSIKDSSHKLLSDAIYAHGMAVSQNGPYEVQEARIMRKDGAQVVSEFIFVGIRENVRDQKSLKGVNRTIIEEAAKVSQDSLDVFVPTVVREQGSQAWFIWNPELVTDPVYKYFYHHRPTNTITIETNYLENPWLSDTMRQLAADCLRDDPEKYRHIWMGEPISTVEGAVYAEEIRQAEAAGRITTVPYDRQRPVDTYWDLGFDTTSIWFVQPQAYEFRVIDYHQDRMKDVDHYLQVLQRKGYTYGTCVLPWDAGDRGNIGRSVESVVRAKGFKARVMEQTKSVVNDLNAVRMIFKQLYFDADRCEAGLNGLRNYRWGPLPISGAEKREPLHDWASHPADALRTMAMHIRAPKAVQKREEVPQFVGMWS